MTTKTKPRAKAKIKTRSGARSKRMASTSRRARYRIAKRIPSMRRRVLAYVRRRGLGGATMDEISKTLRMRIQTVCFRVSELRKSQEICNSGRERETRGHCDAIVWMYAKAKRRAARRTRRAA